MYCAQCGKEIVNEGNFCPNCGTAIANPTTPNPHIVSVQDEIVNLSDRDFLVEGGNLIKYSGNKKDVTIPKTVQRIRAGAFSDNLNIESLVIPERVKEIEEKAFEGCRNLVNITFEGDDTSVLMRHSYSGDTGWSYKVAVTLEGVKIKSEPHKLTMGQCSSLCRYLFPSLQKRVEPDRLEYVKSAYVNGIDVSKKSEQEYAEARAQDEQRREWSRQGLCFYCGGEMSFFKKRCKECGRAYFGIPVKSRPMA